MRDIAKTLYAMTAPHKALTKPLHLLTDAELEAVKESLAQWRQEVLEARKEQGNE